MAATLIKIKSKMLLPKDEEDPEDEEDPREELVRRLLEYKMYKYAAGELKHGTISLIEPGIPVITVATQANVLAKTISNMEEVKARGGMIIAVCRKGTVFAENSVDLTLEIDADLDDMLVPLPTVCALQLIAYYTSVLRGIDPDKPRNLAKAVTTE